MELAASYLLERWQGFVLWDYRDAGYGPTYQGRIAVRSSLQFGLMGMAAVYVVYPLVDWVTSKFQKKLPKGYLALTIMAAAAFLVDLIWHVIFGSNAKW